MTTRDPGVIRTWLRLPGMLCTAEVFTVLDPQLRLPGVAVDLTIQGTTLDEAADHLLIHAKRVPGPAGVIGFSLGAIVIMAALAKEPEAFAAVIVLSTNPQAPRSDQHTAWGRFRQMTLHGEFDQVATELAPLLFSAQHLTPTLLGRGLAMAHAVGTGRLLDQLAIQQSRRDLRAELHRCSVPTLVVAGSADRLCSVGAQSEIAEAMPQGELVVVEGYGHAMSMESPQLIANVLNDWHDRSTA